MRFQVCESDDSCQPGAQYTNPPVVVQEHHGAPLLNCSGLVLVRQLIERLGVARAIDAGVRVLRRCKWYRESDHILTLIYSMLSGGSKLQDVNRLGQDDALKRVLGSDRIPHATTIGKFLWRFGDDQQDKQRQGLAELRDTTAAIQQDAFAMLPRERRKVATLDWDSSIHEVYGQKKEGADFAYDNTWSYSALYGTLAETGDVLYLGLREGYRHTSYGTKEVLPGTIERVSKHFREVRMRADSGYYSQALVKICEERGVEFFIVAKQHRNLMNAVREIQDSNWKSFAGSDLQADARGRRRRRRRANLKRKKGVPQGGVISPLLSNVYLNEVDRMLERAKETTREGQYTYVEYVRWADDLVILVDAYQRHDWLLAAVDKRLREELELLQVAMNEDKSRMVDLAKGDSFGFLGFEFRRVRSLRGVWRPQYSPQMKTRSALLRKLKKVFRRYRSQPVGRVVEIINPILRGWVNYFAIGHSSRCFWSCSQLGGEEDTAAYDARQETPGIWLEEVE